MGALNEHQPQREEVGHGLRKEMAEINGLSPATKCNFRTVETMMSKMMSNIQC